MFALKLLGAFLLSGGVLTVIGSRYYITLALITMVVVLALAIANESSKQRKRMLVTEFEEDTLKHAASEFFYMFGFAIGAGLLWPSLPIAVLYTRP